MTIPKLIITSGEPAGIGPDLCLQLANQPFPAQIVVAADPELLAQRAFLLGLKVALEIFNPDEKQTAATGTLLVAPVILPKPCKAGQLNAANSPYVLEMLNYAIEGCQKGLFDAMVTAPVSKEVINNAGIPFSGHTEFLAEKTHTQKVVMMLATEDLRVALATTHLPLKEVSSAITRSSLEAVIRILHQAMASKFAIKHPRILVCGLNPHAGEGGHLGMEEMETISPVIKELNSRGMNLVGPLPADTLFTPRYLEKADAVLAMYHDQGLPVLKYQGFGNAVNITLGLPITRTSVDHGTALELAGKGTADSGSLCAAIRYALNLL